MAWFQRNHKNDFKLLKDTCTTFLNDFYATFGFNPGVFAKHRPDEVDAAECYLFLSGLVLASYASFAKNTDDEAMRSFATWVIGHIIKEVYKNKTQETAQTLIEKHFDRLADMMETRQNECIDLLVRDILKPRGERCAEGLTMRASELIFKGRLDGSIQLSSFLMKHISNFSRLFQI